MATSPAPTLGHFIQERRQALGLTLRELGERCGLDYSYIARLEQAKNVKSPRPETLQALAGALNVDVEDFYALAGFDIPERLPEFAPYLRAKYDLPTQAVKQLDDYFQLIQDKYGQKDARS